MRRRPRLVRLAVVTAPHGVRGAFRLRCFTERPENVAAYGPVCDEAGRELFALEVLHRVPGGVVVRAPGIGDRDAAERLRGKALFVPRARLPAPGPDEFYHEDLLGLEAVEPCGRRLGRVVAVYDHGAGDVLEIETERGERVDLPFTRAVVPEVDLEGGRLVIVRPAEIEAGPSGEPAAERAA
ncbi:MAG: ribosome maturation factor RimM [Geminicoccaceae bacterium]|nr:ribosome maturation factor RimM [Geminicoccaceae bacterium]MCX8101832.1 ribosome maturation factor RimM [Geminicoccaceae bacterium]MDW8371596.1 ribosome maturation factor RimM [Geminicoccaceae bacterium]